MIEKSSLNSFNETKGDMSSKAQLVLVTLATLFVSLQVCSNVIAGRPISWFGGLFYCASGALLFPFISLISDSLSNIYGTKVVKQVTILGMIINLIFAAICMVVINWPAPGFFENTQAYSTVLNQSWIMVFAGIIALYCSSIVNSLVLQVFKRKQVAKGESTINSKGIFIRSVVSSLPSVALDCTIFNILSFIWSMSLSNIIVMIITQFCVKIIIEIIIQIFVSKWTVPYLVKITGVDVVEEKQRFI